MNSGYIHSVVGPMYAGKTTKLQELISQFCNDGKKVACFTKDTRFGHGVIKNHDGAQVSANYLEEPSNIISIIDNSVDVIAIDEAQFYNIKLVDICKQLAAKGKIVIVAGLDQDYLCNPFETMILLMAESEFITKLRATCECGGFAIRNHRKIKSKERILLGAEDSYESLCRLCYIKKNS